MADLGRIDEALGVRGARHLARAGDGRRPISIGADVCLRIGRPVDAPPATAIRRSSFIRNWPVPLHAGLALKALGRLDEGQASFERAGDSIRNSRTWRTKITARSAEARRRAGCGLHLGKTISAAREDHFRRVPRLHVPVLVDMRGGPRRVGRQPPRRKRQPPTAPSRSRW